MWSDCSDSCNELDTGNHCPQIRPETPPGSQAGNTMLLIHKYSSALVRWLLAFFLLLQTQYHLPDRVLNIIFRVMKTLFVVLGHLYTPCARIGDTFPSTLYMAQKSYKQTRQISFRRYPVCQRCGTVWEYSDCVEGHGVYQKAKLCSYVSPLQCGRYKSKCNGVLLKTVELATGRKIFYPLVTYCYIDLQTSFQSLLLNQDFVAKCTLSRKKSTPDKLLEDIYDGRVWKNFLSYQKKPFLSQEYSYAFMLNIDWFQPYKHLSYSVGAIYLSVLNLPRSVRYKLENICLVGLIPGPREPELTVNSYLDPLVQDLKKFWNGVQLSVSCGTNTERKLVRSAVICCSCDLPAGRKLCGFLGHSAHLGCSKCIKYFPSGESGLDFSGFERETWVPRTNVSHRKDVATLAQCKCKTSLHQKEKELGCRYSSLLQLPYFDPPTMLVIDPMHCLFLGIAKHFFKKILISTRVLSEAHLCTIQKRIDAMSVPSDIGRIPRKIESSFYSFTADQYKNWVLHYSIICLHGLLSSEYLECWRHFVLACRYLCQPSLKQDDVTIADALLLQFCRRTERLFGKEAVTPNMHMCCHLRECILDYGPLNHFWLFAFERFNGILGQLPNNNRSVEVQMMKRFVADTEVIRIPLPTEFREEFTNLVSFQKNPSGSLGTDCTTCGSTGLCDVEFPHTFTRAVFDSYEIEQLQQLFTILYPASTNCQFSSLYRKYSTVVKGGKAFGNFKSRSKNSSIIFAELNGESRPARINYFAKVSTFIDGTSDIHILVCLSWYKNHAQKMACGKPVTVWEHDSFELCNFIPIAQIKSRAVSLVDKLDDVFGNVLFVSPYQ